jgi:D-lactate dehydrogenase (cytochrome)
MIPYSGGSSLEANTAAPYGGFSLDFAFMDKILALHQDDLDVVVQPAVGWMRLNDDIKDSGLFFPVDPGPSAMIGGMVGTSCSGTNAVRYGTMKDNVINLTVVLADGTVIKTKRRPRKSAAGYNLTGLFIGSEGTLGIVTEITLKLQVIPQETSVAVVTFPTIRDAADAASRIIKAGVPIGAMEIMDDVQMSVVNKSKSTKKVWKEVPTLFFKYLQSPSMFNSKLTLSDSPAQNQACKKTLPKSKVSPKPANRSPLNSPPTPPSKRTSGPPARNPSGQCYLSAKATKKSGQPMSQSRFPA